MQRLSSLRKKFRKNEQFKTEYTAFLTEVINKGHAEVVPQDELERSDGKVWYIPHLGTSHTFLMFLQDSDRSPLQ